MMGKCSRISTVIAIVFVSAFLITPVQGALIAHYEFEGNANNSVGREHGELMGDATTVIDPAMGSVLSLDGAGDYVSFTDNLIKTEEFTLAAWANVLGPGGGIKHSNPIFSQRDKRAGLSSGGSTVNLYAQAPNNDTLAGVDIRGNTGQIQNIYAPSTELDQWHHYALTVDTQSITYYLDGKVVASAANLQDGDYDTLIDYISIGRHRYRYNNPGTGDVNSGFFNGLIDDVRIYDFAMTSEELNSLGVPEPVTVLLLGLGGLMIRKRH